MRAGFAKVYKSFEDFEREELDKVGSLSSNIDEMLGEWFVEDLDFSAGDTRKSRGRDNDD